MYAGWRKHLYADAPMRRWLEPASRTFTALEINGSFYSQLGPDCGHSADDPRLLNTGQRADFLQQTFPGPPDALHITRSA